MILFLMISFLFFPIFYRKKISSSLAKIQQNNFYHLRTQPPSPSNIIQNNNNSTDSLLCTTAVEIDCNSALLNSKDCFILTNTTNYSTSADKVSIYMESIQSLSVFLLSPILIPFFLYILSYLSTY